MRFALALVFLLACGAALAADLTMSVRPLFEGRTAARGPTPYVATVTNRGPDATGALLANLGDAGTILYPVNLPRGSTKQITVVVPGTALYGENELVLDTDRGRVRRRISIEYSYGNETTALLIGGSAGELSFQDGGVQVPVAAAPERPILYSTFDYVVLGESAERMSDTSVLALQTYCVAGGTVVLLGGASSPLLQDARWSPFLPMAPTGARNVLVARSVEQLWGRPMPPEPISVTLGTVASSSRVRAKGPVPLVIERSLGEGRIVQFAFNPFDEPLRTWPGRAKMFQRHAPLQMGQLKMLGTESGEYRYMGGGRYSYPSAGGPATAASPVPYPEYQDAFNLELPRWGQVLTLLILYALLAVPINLLLLRRWRKAEWAWVTAPLLSLGFAAAFFSFAGTLYKTPLSSAAEGTLMWDARLPQGYFVGRSQLFVPRGGRYDLGLRDTDYVGDAMISDYGMPGASRVSLDLVDTGSYSAPNARFSNLTYHSLSLGQTVDTAGWLGVAAGAKGVLTITNHSPHTWHSVRLGTVPERVQVIPDLRPGEQWTSGVPVDLGDPGSGPKRSSFVAGVLGGFWPGPHLGRNATRPDGVTFVASFDEEALGR